MKKFIAILIVLVLLSSLTACSPGGNSNGNKETIKVAIVLSGSLGDRNFNDMAFAGLTQAKEELNIEFDYYEPAGPADFESAHRAYAESGKYDLIIGMASNQTDAIVAVSADFPEQKYSFIDATLNAPMISTIATRWPEQTFLCGVIAGLGTLSDMAMANDKNVVGVILGLDVPNLREGVVGFTAGVKYVNKNAEVLEGVVASFTDPAKGKEIALSMYNKGADFIQHIAGASGLGVFDAAEEFKAYAFGVGGNQNGLKADYVVATSIRNVNEIVYNQVKAFVDGTWTAGLHISGLKEGAVGYSVEGSNISLPQNILDSVNEINNLIIEGKLVPPAKAEELDAWLNTNQYTK